MVIKHRYEILNLAEKYDIPSIYDLLDNLHEATIDAIAYTDGKTVYIAPDEFNTRTAMDQFFILCHESLHIIYKHSSMLDSKYYKNHKLLNICQDVVINEKLRKKLRYVPDDAFTLKAYNEMLHKYKLGIRDYDGRLTSRELYDYAKYIFGYDIDYFTDMVYKQFSINGDMIESQDDINNEQESVDLELQIQLRKTFKITNDDILTESKGIARVELIDTDPDNEDLINMAGTGAGQLQQVSSTNISYVKKDDILKWLRTFLSGSIEVKGRSRSYSRPNRRFTHPELVMKGYKPTKSVKQVSIYLDTSGSMDRGFVMEVYNTLKKLYQTTKFRMFTFDMSVHEVDLSKDDSIYVGGGTYITNVLNHISKHNYDHAIMITDCDDNFTLKGIDFNFHIFTNNKDFIPDNKQVKISYWED